MARNKPHDDAGDDLAGRHAAGDLDLSELNRAASDAGAAATTAEARGGAGGAGLADVTTTDVASS